MQVETIQFRKNKPKILVGKYNSGNINRKVHLAKKTMKSEITNQKNKSNNTNRKIQTGKYNSEDTTRKIQIEKRQFGKYKSGSTNLKI